MNAEIICVGTELLLGHVVNTNASYLSKKLACIGVNLYYHTVVGDNPNRLSQMLKMGILRSDIVIITGGLGPTVDDITVETISKTFKCPLKINKKVLADVRNFYKTRNLKAMPERIKHQSSIPQGSQVFKNEVGTAPGILLKEGHKILIALPGPPHEMERMFDKYVIPFLVKKGYAGNDIIKTRSVRISGMIESDVNDKVKDLLSISGRETVGIYVSTGMVDLKITVKEKNEKLADKAINKIQREIEKRLSGYIFGYDDDSLESIVGNILKAKKLTIATAESCTGGLLASKLTDISGSSDYFHMGIIAYANWVKVNLLGVKEENLKKYGAVSGKVAFEMSEGIRKKSGADIGVGITGIAGPTGGTKDKPVGLVYISVSTKKGVVTKEFRFMGSRSSIKLRTVMTALNMVRNAVCARS